MANKNNMTQNQITRESIYAALMILMEQKTFNNITITDLTKRAGVSRMAFYRNYDTKEDIIIGYINELLQDYAKQLSEMQIEDQYNRTRVLFAYFRKHNRLLGNLINAGLSYLILERCIKLFQSLPEEIACQKSIAPVNESYMIEFVSGGIYRLLMVWATNGMKESEEEMAGIVCDALM